MPDSLGETFFNEESSGLLCSMMTIKLVEKGNITKEIRALKKGLVLNGKKQNKKEIYKAVDPKLDNPFNDVFKEKIFFRLN